MVTPDRENGVPPVDEMREATRGSSMEPEQAAALEEQLNSDPMDRAARARLIGYYWRVRWDSESQSRLRDHILWVVRCRPDSSLSASPYCRLHRTLNPEAYQEVASLWIEQIAAHGDDARVLGNAASFFILDDRERALELYRRAEVLEPESPVWPARLGHTLSLGLMSRSGDDRRRAAREAMESYERWLLVMEPPGDFTFLHDLGRMALECDEIERARECGNWLLQIALRQGEERSGNSVHHGHILLGRVALREGAMAEASQHLLAAGRTVGSPQLCSFGPNMSLALELLERGEQDVVLEYFQLCGVFWERERLEEWTEQVRQGKTPEFGANLVY